MDHTVNYTNYRNRETTNIPKPLHIQFRRKTFMRNLFIRFLTIILGGILLVSVGAKSQTNPNVLAVRFRDANNAVAVGAAGFVARSSDGGSTWVSQPSGISVDLNGVSFSGSPGI